MIQTFHIMLLMCQILKSVKETVDEIAKSSNIDILINNAGITGSTSSLMGL